MTHHSDMLHFDTFNDCPITGFKLIRYEKALKEDNERRRKRTVTKKIVKLEKIGQ